MNIVIIGRSREGKTTLALFLARRASECTLAWNPRSAEVLETDEKHTIHSTEELREAINEQWYLSGVLSLKPQELDIVPEFEAYCDWIFRNLRGYSFIVDEAGLDVQKSQAINPHLRRLIVSHGTERACIIQTTHFQADLFRTSTGLVNEMYIFQQTRPADLEIIERQWGEEIAELVANLPKRHCVHIWLDRREEGEPQFEVLDAPELWNVQAMEDTQDDSTSSQETVA